MTYQGTLAPDGLGTTVFCDLRSFDPTELGLTVFLSEHGHFVLGDGGRGGG